MKGKTKRGNIIGVVDASTYHPTPHTQSLFHELGLIYSPTLVFSASCQAFQNLSISTLSFYCDDPEGYERSSKKYASRISRNYVAPGTIKWISEEIGYGYFATQDVFKGEMVGEYTGKIRRRSEFENSVYAWAYPKGGAFQKTLPEGTYLDARTYGNETRFINHHDTPNLKTEQVFHNGHWHFIYVADRYIQRGEEFLVSYGQKYWRKRRKLEW
ncbi:MAG: SET domain-containing protein-lysine N-methyltransferase [Bacteroidota bacterium]